MPGPRSAWRGLGAFWLVVLLLLATAGGTLQYLGPPTKPAEAAHQAPHSPAEHGSAQPAPPAPAAPLVPPGITRPDQALLERSRSNPQLMLPRPGPDGRVARTVYAAPVPPVPAGMKPVALLIAGFGQSERDSRAALDALPGPVSFGISAASAGIASALVEAARATGHELLASVPMEPDGYPLNDEGPRSLRTGLSPEENRTNLEWSLGQTQGAVGATGASDGMRGERFAGVSAAFDPVVEEILGRGLIYIDPRPGMSARPGTRSVDVVLDDSQARAEIESRLAALERTAREKGGAIGLAGQLRPMTLDRIAAWIKGLPARGLVLVPVSSLLEPPK